MIILPPARAHVNIWICVAWAFNRLTQGRDRHPERPRCRRGSSEALFAHSVSVTDEAEPEHGAAEGVFFVFNRFILQRDPLLLFGLFEQAAGEPAGRVYYPHFRHFPNPWQTDFARGQLDVQAVHAGRPWHGELHPHHYRRLLSSGSRGALMVRPRGAPLGGLRRPRKLRNIPAVHGICRAGRSWHGEQHPHHYRRLPSSGSRGTLMARPRGAPFCAFCLLTARPRRAPPRSGGGW